MIIFVLKEWTLQIWSWSSSVQPENVKKAFPCVTKIAHGDADIATWTCRAEPLGILIFKKLAGLWLAGEVVNHVWIYWSKAAEGCSAFKRRSCLLIPLLIAWVAQGARSSVEMIFNLFRMDYCSLCIRKFPWLSTCIQTPPKFFSAKSIINASQCSLAIVHWVENVIFLWSFL